MNVCLISTLTDTPFNAPATVTGIWLVTPSESLSGIARCGTASTSTMWPSAS